MSVKSTHSEKLRQLRNIGISAHVDAGKTTLTERFLFYAGSKHICGDVDDGDTTTDFLPAEKARGITIQSAAVQCHWNDVTINLIDTPGHVDFTMEVERSMRVLDGSVIVICSKGGVQPQTRTVWRQADRYSVPRIIFVNKMDTIGANFPRVIGQIGRELKAKAAVLQLPIGSASTFTGVIDLLSEKALIWDQDDETGSNFSTVEIPGELRMAAAQARQTLVETIVETDDALIEKFLEGEMPSVAELKAALRKAVVSLRLTAVLCGSAFKKRGVQPLLDAVADYLPSPLDVPAVKGVDEKNQEIERSCATSQPLAALAFKVVDDPHGDLVYVRVYSGVLTSGSYVQVCSKVTTDEREEVGQSEDDAEASLSSSQHRVRKERVARLVLMQGNKRIPVDKLEAGDIGAVLGLKTAYTGDTLCADKARPVWLESIRCPKPVISKSIEPADRTIEKDLAKALEALKRSDPSFRVWSDPETHQTIIAGLGELHLEIKLDLLKERGLEILAGKPQVSYRETVAGSARLEHTFKRQNGGHGMFAQVILEIEPLPGGEFEFVDAVVGGDVPREYIGSVEKGIREVLTSGPLGCYPVIGVRVSLVGGKAHDVDSSDMAFKVAAGECFKRLFMMARPTLLEPIMNLEVRTPAKNLGGVQGDISSRRGRVTGTEVDDDQAVVQALVPLATLFGYSTSLRSATQGNGSFSMEPYSCEPVPAEEARRVLRQVA